MNLHELPKVRAQCMEHRGNKCIALIFRYDLSVKHHLLKFRGVSWSRTRKCFYIEHNPDLLRRLIAHCAGHCTIDISALAEATVSPRSTPEGSVTEGTRRPRPTRSARNTKSGSYRLTSRNADAIAQLQRYMEQRRYSASTIRTYLGMLKHFLGNAAADWDQLTQEHISSYNHSEFVAKDRAHSTQNQFINAIKLFYTYHDSAHILPESVERPRKERKLPNILTKTEIQHIIQSTRNLKHRTLLALVYGSGLRIGEALRLELADISREERLLYIRKSKGRKDRRVPLSERQLKMLEDYYLAYRPRKWIFEGTGGAMYSYKSAYHVLKDAVRRAGIRKHVTLHTLRHSFATHLLEAGVGLRYIQDILGHNSPKTTMLYTHVSGKKISEIRSPLDDLDL